MANYRRYQAIRSEAVSIETFVEIDVAKRKQAVLVEETPRVRRS